ncbi:MAG: response regulator, partial [Actinobacteria bacterium]|nr:response regulator [Actinomycetota bacterium]
MLIAEDDRRVRSSLERALTLEGYEVATAGDGASALQLHADHPADLLLLDVSMPNADGLSVCRRLRAQGDDTPVLMLTARHEVHDRVAGLDAGADDYVVKPFALDELLARLRARLRSAVTDEGDQRAGFAGVAERVPVHVGPSDAQVERLVVLNVPLGADLRGKRRADAVHAGEAGVSEEGHHV